VVAVELLGPAVEATRRALRELEKTDVPASLRKIASFTDRQLPRPYRTALVAELESSEWLRSKALEQWKDRDAGDAFHRPSVLFLERPEGWESELEAADRSRQERSARHRQARTEQRAAEAERKEAELRELLAKTRRELDLSRAETEERAAAERAKVGEQSARLKSELATARRELQVRTAELARLRLDMAATAPPRRPVKQPSPAPTRSAVVVGVGNPVEFARNLDRQMEAVARAGRRQEPEPLRPAQFVLGPGVRPDEAAAIDDVLAYRGPLVMLVDGFNVTHALGSGAGIDARRNLEELLRRLRERAAGRLAIEVYWDTSAQPDPADRHRGISVAYVDNADAAIVARASKLRRDRVVVSSDRAVREQSEKVGAICLWSSALCRWFRPG
jgi:hypothetical protein